MEENIRESNGFKEILENKDLIEHWIDQEQQKHQDFIDYIEELK